MDKKNKHKTTTIKQTETDNCDMNITIQEREAEEEMFSHTPNLDLAIGFRI